MKKIDSTFIRFAMVGVANTIFGTAIMFLFYNVFHLSYWVSSASNYIFGSIFVLIVLGMNLFITTQGFSKISMMTTLIGAETFCV